MMSDEQVECPYCGQTQDMDCEDGENYQDGGRCRTSCDKCDETFMINTSVLYNREGVKIG